MDLGLKKYTSKVEVSRTTPDFSTSFGCPHIYAVGACPKKRSGMQTPPHPKKSQISECVCKFLGISINHNLTRNRDIQGSSFEGEGSEELVVSFDF